MFVRGEGCYLWDESGRRHLDALSSLFCVNAGHGRAALADAAAAQARTLAYATTWDTAHPRAIELAERIAGLAPGDLDRVFFTSGGSESVETALKLARAYHRARGEPTRVKVIARELAYHGTTLGALSVTGLPSVRIPFEPLLPGACHVPHTDLYRPAPGRDPLWAADAIAERIAFEGEETVAAVILEPVQNSGGCLPPPPGYFQRVREICDRHGVLLISDDTICGWGRLGTWFGAQRFDLVPDLITTAKGLTSAYVPMGAVIASERRGRPVPRARSPVRARAHVRRPSRGRGGRAGQPRRARGRGSPRPRPPARALAARAPRRTAGAPAGRRRARRGLLLGDRAGRRPSLAPPVRPRGGAHPVRRHPHARAPPPAAGSAAPPIAATPSSSSRRR